MLAFAEDMGNINENPRIYVVTSEETYFHFNGYVNKQNYHYCAPANPQELHQQPLHIEKLTIWVALCKSAVIWSYFFEENGCIDLFCCCKAHRPLPTQSECIRMAQKKDES